MKTRVDEELIIDILTYNFLLLSYSRYFRFLSLSQRRTNIVVCEQSIISDKYEIEGIGKFVYHSN